MLEREGEVATGSLGVGVALGWRGEVLKEEEVDKKKLVELKDSL